MNAYGEFAIFQYKSKVIIRIFLTPFPVSQTGEITTHKIGLNVIILSDQSRTFGSGRNRSHYIYIFYTYGIHIGGSQDGRWWQNSQLVMMTFINTPDKTPVKSNENVTLHVIACSLHETSFHNTYNLNHQAPKLIPEFRNLHYHKKICENAIDKFIPWVIPVPFIAWNLTFWLPKSNNSLSHSNLIIL